MLPQAENRRVLHKGFPQLAFRPQAIFRQLLFVLDVIGTRHARALFEHCGCVSNLTSPTTTRDAVEVYSVLERISEPSTTNAL
jgi:hypothetical protein